MSRQYTVSNNATYLKGIDKFNLIFEKEHLTSNQIFNEYILTGLRTNQGINLSRIKHEFEINLFARHNNFINHCLADNLATLENDRLILTDKALILADSIIIEFMIDE